MAEENKLLELAAEMRRLTYGLCQIGPGPYGFGTSNAGLGAIDLLVNVSPNPYGDTPVPPGVENYTVSVIGRAKESTQELAWEEVLSYAQSADPITRKIAEALLELQKKPFQVNKAECDAAFGALAELELSHQTGLTKDEAVALSESGWYEGKSVQEIVEFQLGESHLCMPFDRLQQALEITLGRPVFADEFPDQGRLAQEYAAVKQTRLEDAPAPKAGLDSVSGNPEQLPQEKAAPSLQPPDGDAHALQ